MNSFCLYFDLEGEDADDAAIAQIYTDVLIQDPKYMVVSINVPNVCDTCGGGGHSYILRGNWSLNPYNMVIKSTKERKALLNEGTMYFDENGLISDIIQDDTAVKSGPKDNDPNTRPTQLSKNASWLRLY